MAIMLVLYLLSVRNAFPLFRHYAIGGDKDIPDWFQPRSGWQSALEIPPTSASSER